MKGRPACEPIGNNAGPEVVPAVFAVIGEPGEAEPDAELELKGTAMFALTAVPIDHHARAHVAHHVHEDAHSGPADRMNYCAAAPASGGRAIRTNSGATSSPPHRHPADGDPNRSHSPRAVRGPRPTRRACSTLRSARGG